MKKFYDPAFKFFLQMKSLPHPEKCFVESTKFWSAQQNFSFKYGSMKILFELAIKILLIFFFNLKKKKHFASTTKNMELQIKVTKLLQN